MSFTSTLFLHKFLPTLLFVYFSTSYLLKNKTVTDRNKILNMILLIFSVMFFMSADASVQKFLTDTSLDTIYNAINDMTFNSLKNMLNQIKMMKFPITLYYLLIAITISYVCGLLIQTNKYNNKRILTIGIILELGILFYFKYMNFFLTSFSQAPLNIIVPLGVSFYIFQAISYIWDCYHDPKLVQKNFFSLLLYIVLFFKLVAGPIVKYRDIESQFLNREIDSSLVLKGVKRFLLGICKKVFIADTLGIIVNGIFTLMINGSESVPIFDSMPIENISPMMLWIGSICYTLQIYYDFSAYSDMAIGLATMFGFSFFENFNFPYSSKSITEFWKRWHISLTSWFREYVYFPLGGNRKGTVRTSINLLLIFILSGFWHGANWNFLIWGLIHGLFLILERFGFNKFLPKFLSGFYTMMVVHLAWIFFYFSDFTVALAVIKQMFNVSQWLTLPNYTELFYIYESLTVFTLLIFLIALFFCTPIYSLWKSNLLEKRKFIINMGEIGLLLLLFALSTNVLLDQNSVPFIYFQF